MKENLQAQVLPSDVSDVLVACSMPRLPAQTHGAWSGGGGRLTSDSGLVILSRLHNSRRVTC